MTRYRWFILALIFLVTTNNYLDRTVFSVLIPIIRDDLHISTEQYGYISGAFQMAYGIGFLVAGGLIDRFGTRIGYSFSILWWSVAACLHALSRSALQLGMWRGLLGIRRGGELPVGDQGGSRVVPEEGPCLCHGHLQRGHQRGRHGRPAAFRMDGDALRMAGLLPDHRLHGVRPRRDLGGACTVCQRSTGR